jgi:hypothetical protein
MVAQTAAMTKSEGFSGLAVLDPANGRGSSKDQFAMS